MSGSDGATTRDLVRTLFLSGYEIDSAKRIGTALFLDIHKVDELGGIVRYAMLVDDNPPEDVVDPFARRAREDGATPLVIGACTDDQVQVVSLKRLYEVIGGVVSTDVVHDPQLPDTMDALGHNRLPKGFSGIPADLLEDRAKQCLQFLTGGRARRYGADRLFESIPDGIVLPGRVVLFDTKAYEDGYEFSADDMKRYAAYVREFNDRYAAHLGRVFAFLIVSGEFADSDSAIEGRRAELYASCETQLCCIQSGELGEMARVVRSYRGARASVLWESVFSNLQLKPRHVLQQLKRVAKDKV